MRLPKQARAGATCLGRLYYLHWRRDDGEVLQPLLHPRQGDVLGGGGGGGGFWGLGSLRIWDDLGWGGGLEGLCGSFGFEGG